jgi:phage baseplate assembly protein V
MSFDLKRLLEPIKRKLMLIVGRCILSAINNSEKTQKLQVKAMSGETITDVERYQEYGLESFPLTDKECLIVCVNGNRDQGIIIKVHDRENRPTDLSSGDVVLYDYRGNQVRLESGKVKIVGNTAIELNGNTKRFVTHGELDAALQSWRTAFDAALVIGIPAGVWAPGTTPALDISTSETSTIKTGG